MAAEAQKAFPKPACELLKCFYLSNDFIISTGSLLLRLSIL